MKYYRVDKDAWASGQIGSKKWLCEELEKIQFSKPPIIWILGGWYGKLAFILDVRDNFPITHVRSFDIDPNVEPIADMINENSVYNQWKFKAFTVDCNKLNYSEPWVYNSDVPDIVINTSSEHFETMNWFNQIPVDTLTVIQSNDMDHSDHHHHVTSISEMKEKYPLSEYLYCGEKYFEYDTWSFTRYMVIGRK